MHISPTFLWLLPTVEMMASYILPLFALEEGSGPHRIYIDAKFLCSRTKCETDFIYLKVIRRLCMQQWRNLKNNLKKFKKNEEIFPVLFQLDIKFQAQRLPAVKSSRIDSFFWHVIAQLVWAKFLNVYVLPYTYFGKK